MKNRNKNGYVLLMSILVVSAIGLTIGTSLILLGLGSSNTSFSYEKSNEAKALANACVEAALQQIWGSDFVGSDNLALGNGTCSYTVTNTGGDTRTIDAIGTVDTIVRKDKITINQLNPTIETFSWQEVSDF